MMPLLQDLSKTTEEEQGQTLLHAACQNRPLGWPFMALSLSIASVCAMRFKGSLPEPRKWIDRRKQAPAIFEQPGSVAVALSV